MEGQSGANAACDQHLDVKPMHQFGYKQDEKSRNLILPLNQVQYALSHTETPI